MGPVGGCFAFTEGDAAVETLAQRDQLQCWHYRVRESGLGEVALSLLWEMPQLRILPDVISLNAGRSACE
jgi:hypothetical protein